MAIGGDLKKTFHSDLNMSTYKVSNCNNLGLLLNWNGTEEGDFKVQSLLLMWTRVRRYRVTWRTFAPYPAHSLIQIIKVDDFRSVILEVLS